MDPPSEFFGGCLCGPVRYACTAKPHDGELSLSGLPKGKRWGILAHYRCSCPVAANDAG
jgi:hypothetical protein